MLTLTPKNIPLQNGERVLDLGCGEGRHTLGLYYHFHRYRCEFIGLDLNEKDVLTAHSRIADLPLQQHTQASIHFIRGNGLVLPFENNSLDHIVCSEVLEHIPDYGSMLAEVQRVLKPGGSLCVSVPRTWPEKICWWLESAYHQVEGGHLRIFNGRQLKKQILQQGYVFQKKHWAHALHVPYWWLRCLFWQRGDNYWPVRLYHKLLVWDLFHKPWLTQWLDKLLNPLMGKSLVLYFTKK